MLFPKKGHVLAGLVVAALLVVMLIPVVPDTLRVDNSTGFPYQLQGYRACEAQFAVNNTINVSNPGFQSCIAPFLIPPINVTGYGSVLSRLLGVGPQPFPDRFLVGETGFDAYLFMKGPSIAAAQLVEANEVAYNPVGIEISNSSVSQGFLGANTNITVTVENRSGQTLLDPFVYASVPGASGNSTDNSGVTWMFDPYEGNPPPSSPCMTDGRFVNLTSGASCTAILSALMTVPLGSAFRYTLEVQGFLGTAASITKQEFSYSISPQAADRLWVNAFIGLINEARGGMPLTESSTLDSFAKLRFNTAVTQPDISDYGFDADVTSFFGANTTRPAIAEDLFYPNMTAQAPYSLVSVLQGSAPGHWASLTNKDYTRFGFYVGTGPYETVQQPCPVNEVPGGGINITQYFESAGCSVTVQQSTWLVIILSS